MKSFYHEAIGILRETTESLSVRSLVEDVQKVWGVGSCSFIQVDEDHELRFKLAHSRSGAASVTDGFCAPNGHVTSSPREGIWADEFVVEFRVWVDYFHPENPFHVRINATDTHEFYATDRHIKDRHKVLRRYGLDYVPSSDDYWFRHAGFEKFDARMNRSGNLVLFATGEKLNRSFVETMAAELCEQRILNKQLPLEYKY